MGKDGLENEPGGLLSDIQLSWYHFFFDERKQTSQRFGQAFDSTPDSELNSNFNKLLLQGEAKSRADRFVDW